MDDLSLFVLAERVATAASELGIATALIGASALAAHNFVRGTKDVDMASAVDPYSALRKLQSSLEHLGLKTKLNLPDGDDDLGGLLQIWEPDYEDEDGDPTRWVEIVNFANPHRPGLRTPAAAAIKNAVRLDEQTALRYVQLPDLVALKTYAGALKDFADIDQLLEVNPSADLDEVLAIAKPYDRCGQLQQLIDEIRRRRSSKKHDIAP